MPAILHRLGVIWIEDGILHMQVIDAFAQGLERVCRCFAADARRVPHIPERAELGHRDPFEQQRTISRGNPVIVGLKDPLESAGPIQFQHTHHHVLADVGHLLLRVTIRVPAAEDTNRFGAKGHGHGNRATGLFKIGIRHRVIADLQTRADAIDDQTGVGKSSHRLLQGRCEGGQGRDVEIVLEAAEVDAVETQPAALFDDPGQVPCGTTKSGETRLHGSP